MSAAAAAVVPAEPEPKAVESADKKERDVVIVDVKTADGKTVAHTTSFTMTWKDKETGRVQIGTFTARRPSLGVLGQMAVMKAKLNGGQAVDGQTDFYHEMIANLHYTLVEFPDWWTPADFFDARPLREVWDHVRSWIDTFRSRSVG